MAAPRNNTYGVESGDGVHAGRRRAIPLWVPSTVGQMAAVPMTNTLDSVRPSARPGLGSAQFLSDFSGGVANPHFGNNGCIYMRGAGHSGSDDSSLYRANLDTLAFELAVAHPDLTVKFVNYSGIDATWRDYYGTSLGYFVRKGPNSTDWEDPDNSAAWQYADELDSPCELVNGHIASAHTYASPCVLPPELGGAGGAYFIACSFAVGFTASAEGRWAHMMREIDGAYSRFGTSRTTNPSFFAGCIDRVRGRWKGLNRGHLDLSTGVWADDAGSVSAMDYYGGAILLDHDTERDIYVSCGQNAAEIADATAIAANPSRWFWWPAGTDTGARNLVTWVEGTQPPNVGDGQSTMRFVEELGKFFFYSWWTTPNSFWWVTPAEDPSDPWTAEQVSITGLLPDEINPAPPGWIYRSMDVMPQLKSAVWLCGFPRPFEEFGGRVFVLRLWS